MILAPLASGFRKRRRRRAALHFEFLASKVSDVVRGITPSYSGGVNGTVMNASGQTVAASCPRVNHGNPRTNLLLYSEQFDNAAWNADPGATCSSANAATAQNGTLTADELNIAGASYRSQNAGAVGVVGTTYTFSCWVKQAASGSAAATRLTSNNSIAWGTGGSTKIALTSEWQRASVTWTQSGGTTIVIGIGALDAAGVQDTACNGKVLVWGAQLEAGAFPTSYIPTTDAARTVAECLGLLIEEQRTNLLLRSEEFDNAVVWPSAAAAITRTANAITGYDLIADNGTANDNYGVYQSVSIAESTTYSCVVRLKKKDYRYVQVNFVSGTASNHLAYADLETGAVTGVSNVTASPGVATIDGGFDFTFAFASGAGETSCSVYLLPTDTDTTSAHVGVVGAGTYLGRAQLEAGAFVTSYIPTGASAVTRTADVITLEHAASGVGTAAGTFVVEHNYNGSASANPGNRGALGLTTADGAYRAIVYNNSGGAGGVYVRAADGADVFSYNGPSAGASTVTTALFYGPGGEYGAHTPPTALASVAGASSVIADTSRTYIGSIGQVGQLGGHIRRLTYYAERLTNEELQGAIRGDGAPALLFDFRKGNIADAIQGVLPSYSGGVNGTRVNSAGQIVPAACPRINYDPVTLACKGLLVEEARTNKATYSADFTTYTGGAQITADQGTAPDGTTAADLISAATGDIYRGFGAHGGATHCLSMFVKPTTAPYFMLSFGAPSTQRVVFDLSSGAVSATVGSIAGSSEAWGNGWFRLVIVGVPAGATDVYNQFNAYASLNYADRTTGALVWGAQFEAGAFPTSYIPTTSAAVTRTADVVSHPLVGTLNPQEGALVVVADRTAAAASGARKFLASIEDGAGRGDMLALLNQRGALGPGVVDDRQDAIVQSAGVTQAEFQAAGDAAMRGYMLSYKRNSFKAKSTGNTEQSDAAGDVPVLANPMLYIGQGAGGVGQLGGNIQMLAYFPWQADAAHVNAVLGTNV
ncbi:MAG: phage head spike fiber domain-containing protein [Ramlibacter sp.]